MDLRFWRNKWFLTAVIITIALVASALFLTTIKISDYSENDADMQHFSSQPGVKEVLTALERLTPPGAVVLCWWDYGRSVREWSHREVIEAYPSRETSQSVGFTRSILGTLDDQIFAKWGSHEKIQDVAIAFMLNEKQSLPILRKYNLSYVLVFMPDELEKFTWIA